MNSTYYFGVMVRLFAIGLFIYGISQFEFVAGSQNYNDAFPGPSLFFSLLSSLLPIFISIVLWFFPLTIARKILPTTNEDTIAADPHSLLTAIILGIALYTLFYSVADGIYWITYANIFIKDEFGAISRGLSNQGKSYVVSTIVELTLSLFLIARARTIAFAMMKFTR